MPKPVETSRHRLMVEGSDDQWSIINLLAKHGVDWARDGATLPWVHDSKGVEKLLGAIKTTAKSVDRLGVVMDADEDLSRRWQQMRDRFAEAGVAFPASPREEGTVVTLPDGRRFGAWLMPDNRLPGKLEDFLATLVPRGDSSWAHAGAATLEAQRLGAPLALADAPKGQIHAWLAWRAQPGVPFGTAITSAVLRHDSESAQRFVAWFNALFRA